MSTTNPKPSNPAIEALQATFAATIIERDSVGGVPILALKKDDVPVVAHYVHTHPSLRGTLSLLWAVDHRPVQARYELFYLFTLTGAHDWLLLSTELRDDDRFFHSITPHVHAAQ